MRTLRRKLLHFFFIKIETYWNVNAAYCFKLSFCPSIKIETYWNVNKGTKIWKNKIEGIKIETYWNVNLEKSVLIQYCDMH